MARSRRCSANQPPGQDGATGPAWAALGLLLNNDEEVSDFIAFLGGLDPQPLIAALGLDATDPVLHREEKLRSDLGRADLILRDGTIPRVLTEIKVAATEHGDRFSRYQNWAAGQNPPVAYVLAGVDGARKDVPETWVSKVTPPVLFRSWCNSTDCHVAWLASLAADLFEQWSNEVDGFIGHATSRAALPGCPDQW